MIAIKLTFSPATGAAMSVSNASDSRRLHCHRPVSHRERPVLVDVTGWSRPFSDIHLTELATAKQSLAPGLNKRDQPLHERQRRHHQGVVSSRQGVLSCARTVLTKDGPARVVRSIR